MAIDRQGTGLVLIRVCLGVFFLCEGIGKLAWFTRQHKAAMQDGPQQAPRRWG